MMKFWQKIVRWFNRTFRGYKYTNVAGFTQENRCLSKKQIIRKLVEITGKINKNPNVIDDGYVRELRQTGKRALLKALVILNIAYSREITGGKNAN